MSQPTRAAWIEMALNSNFAKVAKTSQPTRAAWIEIIIYANKTGTDAVAAHSGCVD